MAAEGRYPVLLLASRGSHLVGLELERKKVERDLWRDSYRELMMRVVAPGPNISRTCRTMMRTLRSITAARKDTRTLLSELCEKWTVAMTINDTTPEMPLALMMLPMTDCVFAWSASSSSVAIVDGRKNTNEWTTKQAANKASKHRPASWSLVASCH